MKSRRPSLAVFLAAFGALGASAVLQPQQPARDSPPPILEAVSRANGCCEAHYAEVRLRVFEDGRAEWDEPRPADTSSADAGLDQSGPAREFVRKQAVLTKKELNAVNWAVHSMSLLQPKYRAPAADTNIDNDDWMEFSARDNKKTYKVSVAFGNLITEENYRGAPRALKTVVCNIEKIRLAHTHETGDLDWCANYWMGW